MQLPEQAEQDFEVEMKQKSRPVTEVPSVLPELGEEKQETKWTIRKISIYDGGKKQNILKTPAWKCAFGKLSTFHFLFLLSIAFTMFFSS